MKQRATKEPPQTTQTPRAGGDEDDEAAEIRAALAADVGEVPSPLEDERPVDALPPAEPEETPEDAAARRQAEVFGRLAEECGTASRFWIRRERDPEDPRSMQTGVYPRAIVGRIDGGVVADRIGGGGLIYVTPDDPYDEKRGGPPRWYGPVRLLGEPKQIGLDLLDASGRPAEHAAAAPGASAPGPATDPLAGYVNVIDDESGEFKLIPKAAAERILRERREAKQKAKHDAAAIAGLAEVRAELQNEQRRFNEAVLARLDKLTAAAPAPAASVESKYLTQMIELQKEQARAEVEKAKAAAIAAAEDAKARIRELELKASHAASAPPPAATPAADPMKMLDLVLGLVEKAKAVTGVAAAEKPAGESVASVLKGFLGEVANGARVLYGDPEADRESGGPLRRYAEAVVDQATVIPRAPAPTVTQVAPNPATAQQLPAPEEKKPEPSEAQKKAALETLQRDLTAICTTLAAVVAGEVDPAAAWAGLRGHLSPLFAAEIKKRDSAEKLAAALKDLATNRALVNYADDFRALAAKIEGEGKPFADRFVAAAQAA